MASSSSSSRILLGLPLVLPPLTKRHQTPQSSLQIRARCYRDNVDGKNMRILKERMEEIRVKESLERCLVAEHGWNYIPMAAADDYKKKETTTLKGYREVSELAAVAGATFGFTILSGTLCLCLASILIHLNF